MTSFFIPSENFPANFAVEGSVVDLSDLNPNDIMYIWLERTLEKGSSSFSNNDIVLNIKYNVR